MNTPPLRHGAALTLVAIGAFASLAAGCASASEPSSDEEVAESELTKTPNAGFGVMSHACRVDRVAFLGSSHRIGTVQALGLTPCNPTARRGLAQGNLTVFDASVPFCSPKLTTHCQKPGAGVAGFGDDIVDFDPSNDGRVAGVVQNRTGVWQALDLETGRTFGPGALKYAWHGTPPAPDTSFKVSRAKPSPDGTLVALVGPQGVALSRPNGAFVGVVHMAPSIVFAGQGAAITDVAWSPDGTTLAIAEEAFSTRFVYGPYVVERSPDDLIFSRIGLYDVARVKLERGSEVIANELVRSETEVYYRIAYKPDGSAIAAITYPGRKGKVPPNAPPPKRPSFPTVPVLIGTTDGEPRPLAGPGLRGGSNVSFSADSERVVVTGWFADGFEGSRIWDTETMLPAGEIAGAVLAALSPDHKLVAVVLASATGDVLVKPAP